ncbi:MAG: DNA helicase UvrBC, partial [Planctomycetaceae bacterium]
AMLSKESASPVASIAGALAKQLKLGGKGSPETETKECPVCGISFFEFRNSGRLGCPYDYTHFEKELEPLLINIHDSSVHRGKQPHRAAVSADSQARLIRLRREMEEAIEREDYELASSLRDQIRQLEDAGKS